MEQSRVKNSIKNTSFGMIGMAVSLLVQFISRTVFIKLLGDAYNGINGLFSNILYVLNLAELGFAYSIAYALYAPLEQGNKEKICAIMNYLRKVYGVIACVVAIAGLACIPFLQYLIKDDIASLPFTLNQLRVYFAIYLGNTVFSYVFSYKRTLITADQRAYIVSNADNISNIILFIVQIALLFVWKNYYLYLALMVSKTLITNIALSLIADKRYPYLRENRALRLGKEDCAKIAKNVSAMFFHKFGGVVIYGTTTIIISAFVGVVEAGYYSNYLLLVRAVNAFINIAFNSITASVGNLCVSESRAYQKQVFYRVSYAANFFAIFSFVCYATLFNDFIALWVGADKTLSFATALIISASAALTTLRSATNTFKDAKGLFVKDWGKCIVEAFGGVAMAIAFSYLWGTFGVVLGYTLASLIVALPVENIVLFKFGFEEKAKALCNQFLRLLWAAVQAIAIALALFFAVKLLPVGGVGWFIVKAGVCVLATCLAYFLLSFRGEPFAYYKNMLFRLIKRR